MNDRENMIELNSEKVEELLDALNYQKEALRQASNHMVWLLKQEERILQLLEECGLAEIQK